MKLASLLFLALVPATAADPDVIVSKRADSDFELTADSQAPQWKGVAGVVAENNARGEPTPGHRTEIKSRWTDENLYLLYICHYEQLNLKPNPVTDRETRELWNWDVAEVFIGANFTKINYYRELQVSPQGEYIDLDINSEDLNGDRDMKWDSGYKVKARIDATNKVWYGEMRIPFKALDSRAPKAGNELRANFYRLQGPKPNQRQVTWRPTGKPSHHVPESFGRLVLGN